jgi:N4-gp56 family major capsid protein
MAEFSWEFDAPTGVYKNHAISNKLLEVAVLKSKIFPFSQKINAFGKKMGEKITLFHYKPQALPTDATLSELEKIPLEDMEMDSVTIQVYELGRGIQFTSLAQALGKFDPKTSAQKNLSEQMRRYLDVATATALKECKVKYIPTSATAATWDTDGTASTEATANFNLNHAAIIRDYMANDLHVPAYEDDNWVGIFATKALRGIKNDSNFEIWKQYLRDEDLLYKSEVGRAEQIRFVEIMEETALSNSIGSGSVLGEGLIFGDEAVARAEAETPHLRYQPNVNNDFGRRHAAAWYGIIGFGLFWDSADDREAKVVHVTSS